jgi:hypothetical protein
MDRPGFLSVGPAFEGTNVLEVRRPAKARRVSTPRFGLREKFRHKFASLREDKDSVPDAPESCEGQPSLERT